MSPVSSESRAACPRTLCAPVLLEDAAYRFSRVSMGDALWWAALELVDVTYRQQGLPVSPAADPNLVRLCCETREGVLVGTVGLRTDNFSCQRSFPEAFSHHVGTASAVEFTQFAVEGARDRRLAVTLRLLSLAFLQAREANAHYMICEVRPAHASFYLQAGLQEVARREREGWHPALFLVGAVKDVEAALQQGSLQKRGLPLTNNHDGASCFH